MNLSNIQWTTYTHNFWTGCKKVSAGCKYCYMYRMEEEMGRDGDYVHRAEDASFNKPLKMKKPELVFTCSMSDFFIEEADLWRAEAWKVIKNTPQHSWQILTKRPERISKCLPADWGKGYPNVWLGVTVENQATIGRINELLKAPAQTYFISAEPLLEEVHFINDGKNLLDKINWIIVGGESGNDSGRYRYRECQVSWMEKVVNDAKGNGFTKVFVKQMGTSLAKKGIGSLIKAGPKLSRHGDEFDTFPDTLRIREMPDAPRSTLF